MRNRIVLPLFFGLVLAMGGVLWAAAAGSSLDLPAEVDPRYGGRSTELVSQFWGSFAAIKTMGNYGYVPQGQRLSVFDISDPDDIHMVGQSEVMTGPSDNLEISGDYAFLVDPGVLYYDVGSRLHVMDISDPSAPFEAIYLENEGDKAYDIELYNGYAFIANDDDLWVVDVHDPLNPVSVRHRGISDGSVQHIRVGLHALTSIPYAYLLAGDFLVVFDITDPTNPIRRSSLEICCDLEGLALRDNRVYIINDYGGLYVVDISDPLHPAVVGDTSVSDYTNNLEVFGNMLYVGGYDGLHILDASGPGSPSSLGLYPTSLYVLGMDQIPGQERVLVITPADLAVVDVNYPASPTELGSFHQEGGVFNIVGSGDRLYISRGVSSYRPTSVEAYDFEDPYNPIKLGSLPLKAHVDSVAGNYLYLLLPPDFRPDPSIMGGLVVVDVSDPAHMSVTDIFTTTSYDSYAPYDIAVHGNIAYYADGYDGLRLIDTSDPYHLTEIGRYDPVGPIYAVSVAVPANEPDKVYAYLGTDSPDEGFRILDVTDPHSIIEKGSISGPNATAVYHTLVYSPNLTTGTLPAAGYYIAIAEGEYVSVFDVSNPDAPVLVGFAGAQAEIYNLTVEGDFLYVAAGLKGARMYQYTGTNLDLDSKGYYRLPEEVTGIAVNGAYLYLATGTNGLFNAWFGQRTDSYLETTGGSITSTFHGTMLSFPTETFTTSVAVEYQPRYPGNMPSQEGLSDIGVYYELTAWKSTLGEYLSPESPYTFVLHYDEADLGGQDETTLGLYYWNGSRWVKERTSSVDPVTNTLTADTRQTERLAVLAGEEKIVFLPITTR